MQEGHIKGGPKAVTEPPLSTHNMGCSPHHCIHSLTSIANKTLAVFKLDGVYWSAVYAGAGVLRGGS